MNTVVHSDHCRACKERIRELLTAIYGDCSVGRQFPWAARSEVYAATAIGSTLERIRSALRSWRGHRDFIKSAQVPPCDFFVADPPFILEFDESQHFSRARAITLEIYPKTLPVNYSIAGWLELCRKIDATDDQPFDRDERRAWYDSLRDLVPLVHGFRPTARLYAGAHEWCALDPAAGADLARFKRFLGAASFAP
jgi:hypothetical protein